MARMPISKRQRAIVSLICITLLRNLMMMILISYLWAFLELLKNKSKKNAHSAKRSLMQGLKNVNEYLRDELSCFDQLRMDRQTFHKLCELLKDKGGLKESRNMFVEERVAIFLNIMGHDQKQRVMVRRLRRSKETITRNFRGILRCVLRLHKVLLKDPEPIPENSNDERWKWFKSHKDARGMFRKPFPFYDDLEVIYSKDRATGLKAALAADRDEGNVVHDNIQEEIQEVSSEKGEEVPSEMSETTKQAADDSSSKNPAKKKLRKNNEFEGLQNSLETMMGKMIESSNVQIEKLVSVFEGPKNVKFGLREELGKVPGITRAQALSLCVKMNEDEVVIFRDLNDDDEKYDFLLMVLGEK